MSIGCTLADLEHFRWQTHCHGLALDAVVTLFQTGLNVLNDEI